jgi:hypothetical protein
VKPDGVSFTANKTRDEEFIGGRDKWFRPIETRIGPDGALYIIDFYNQAVIHNDTRGPKHNAVNAAVRPDRDHYFGRIWRVQHKEAKPAPAPNLAKASAAELVKALDHPNRPVRMTAQRLIAENPTPEVIAMIQQQPTSQQSKIHRIWLMGQTRSLTPGIMTAALADSQPAVRKAALQVAALAASTNPNDLKKSALGKLNDPEPRVRLEAIVALGAVTADKDVADALLKGLRRHAGRLDSISDCRRGGGEPARIHSRRAGQQFAGYLSRIDQRADDAGGAESGEGPGHSRLRSRSPPRQAPASADALKIAIFETLSKSVKPEFAPKWSQPLREAFKSATASPNAAVPAAVLPLIARWDRNGAMADDLKGLIQQLLAKLNDANQERHSARAGREQFGRRAADERGDCSERREAARCRRHFPRVAEAHCRSARRHERSDRRHAFRQRLCEASIRRAGNRLRANDQAQRLVARTRERDQQEPGPARDARTVVSVSVAHARRHGGGEARE